MCEDLGMSTRQFQNMDISRSDFIFRKFGDVHVLRFAPLLIKLKLCAYILVYVACHWAIMQTLINIYLLPIITIAIIFSNSIS